MILQDLTKYRLVYLASPYTKYAGGIDQANDDICEVAAKMIAAGVKVFCPVAHAHAIAMSGGLNPLDHDLWLGQDEAIAPFCQALVVAELDGWRESYGVSQEILWFATRQAFSLNPRTMGLTKLQRSPSLPETSQTIGTLR